MGNPGEKSEADRQPTTPSPVKAKPESAQTPLQAAISPSCDAGFTVGLVGSPPADDDASASGRQRDPNPPPWLSDMARALLSRQTDSRQSSEGVLSSIKKWYKRVTAPPLSQADIPENTSASECIRTGLTAFCTLGANDLLVDVTSQKRVFLLLRDGHVRDPKPLVESLAQMAPTLSRPLETTILQLFYEEAITCYGCVLGDNVADVLKAVEAFLHSTADGIACAKRLAYEQLAKPVLEHWRTDRERVLADLARLRTPLALNEDVARLAHHNVMTSMVTYMSGQGQRA